MTFEFLNSDGLIKAALLLPLAAAFLSFKIKDPNKRDLSTIVIAIALFLLTLNVFDLKVNEGKVLEYKFANFVEGIPIYFNIDYLGVLFSLLASFLWIVTMVYSIGYMRGNKEPDQNRFFGFFGLSIFATIGIAFSGNLLTLFIFYEVLTLSTYPLVTHSGSDEAKQKGRVYLGVLLFTSVLFLLPAIIITYFISGSLDFASKPLLGNDIKPVYIGLLLLTYVWGVGKTAVMPFHKWLPSAMVAPTPVSALLHAVAVVKAGLFTILKIVVYVFGVENLQNFSTTFPLSVNWMAWLALFTIITASIIALKQDNLKLRLAYSTISQLSYVVLAAGMFNTKALIGGTFHIAAHAFAKITLFFVAGAIYTASKKKYVSELGGIAKRMPITCICFSIGVISMVGLPPTAGVISKFYLIQGAHQSNELFVFGLVISTILNAMYFLPIVFAMFFEKETVKAVGNYRNHGEAPKQILIAITITAIMTVAIFLYSGPIINLAVLFAGSIK